MRCVQWEMKRRVRRKETGRKEEKKRGDVEPEAEASGNLRPCEKTSLSRVEFGEAPRGYLGISC